MPKVWNVHDPKCPKDAVRVDRTTKWGNPFKIGKDINGIVWTRANVIELYAHWLFDSPHLVVEAKQELRGKDLVCHCAPKACHADVLLNIANSVE